MESWSSPGSAGTRAEPNDFCLDWLRAWQRKLRNVMLGSNIHIFCYCLWPTFGSFRPCIDPGSNEVACHRAEGRIRAQTRGANDC